MSLSFLFAWSILILQELQIGLRLLQSTFLKAKSGTFSKILWTSQPSPLNLANKIGYKNLVSGGAR
jgi:hypothetical protein